MPEDNENEFALEPVLDSPPDPITHSYMTPGIANSVTVLDDFAQTAVDEFKQERLELDSPEDDTASNLPAKVDSNQSEVIELLGGVEAASALGKVLSDPSSDLAQILPSEQIESLVWSALENPATQAVVLQDPAVLAAISNQLFFGHSIQDIQSLLAQYQRGDGLSEEQLEQQHVESETRVQNFQRSFFTEGIDELVSCSGVDESDVEGISDRLLLARTRFLDANHQEFLHMQGLHEAGRTAPVQEARLRNKWTATLLKELAKISGSNRSAKVKTKPMNTRDAKDDDRPAKPIDAGINNNGDWLHEFTKDFSKERKARGLLTAEEKRQQGKH
jgi:hypothetical protein